MPIDASIPLQVKGFQMESPMAQFGNALALQAGIGKNQLAQMQMRQLERQVADEEAIRGVMSAPGMKLEDAPNALLGKGFYKPALEIQGKVLEQRKTTAGIAKDEAETNLKHLGVISGALAPIATKPDVTLDDIAGVLATAQAAGVPQSVIKGIAEAIPKNAMGLPQFVKNLAMTTERGVAGLKLVLPDIAMTDVGGSVVPVNKNPLAGPVGPLAGGSTLTKTNTPDAILTDARARSEGDKNRGVTVRGQNMTDARARELADAAKLSQPFEATINGRPVLVQQNKSTGEIVDVNTKKVVGNVAPKASDAEQLTSGYAKRMAEAEKVLSANTGGQTPGLTETAIARSPTLANLARPEERQRYHQAQEDWVRAKLRKESGAVIADEEMAREIRTYFPQIGDKASVIAQKAAARKTAMSAMDQASGPARGNAAAGGWQVEEVK